MNSERTRIVPRKAAPVGILKLNLSAILRMSVEVSRIKEMVNLIEVFFQARRVGIA